MIVFILLSFVFTPIYAAVKEGEVVSLYKQFKEPYKYLSPTYGLLLLNSKTLAHIRFKGNYGKNNDNFLCHKQITHPAPGNASQADKDCPQDNTSAIIQHIFPSPTHTGLAITTASSDFFGQLSIEGIGTILDAYERHALTPEIFATLAKNRKSAISSSWQKAGLADSPGQAFQKLTKLYADMFLGARKEANIYPYHVIEAALLALALEKANSIEDLKPLLDQLKNYQDYNSITDTNTHTKKILDKNDYFDFKEKYISKKGLSRDLFYHLLKDDPEALMFYTLAYDRFESFYPLMIGTKSIKVGDFEFSDCGESALLNFFNILLSAKNQVFDTKNLKKAFPKASSKIFSFFEQQFDFRSINKPELRAQWGAIVSQLPGVIYAKGKVCEIAPTGIDNFLEALKSLLNDDYLQKINFSQDNSARKEFLDYVFSKLSHDDLKFDWKSASGDKNIESQFDEIIIREHNQDLFTMKFTSGHFEILPIESEEETDWRKKGDLLLPLLKSSRLDLIASLAPYYYKNNLSLEYIHESTKDQNELNVLAASLLYGLSSKNKTTQMKLIVSVSSFPGAIAKEIAQHCAFLWFKNEPELFRLMRPINLLWAKSLLLYALKNNLLNEILTNTYFFQEIFNNSLKLDDADIVKQLLLISPELINSISIFDIIKRDKINIFNLLINNYYTDIKTHNERGNSILNIAVQERALPIVERIISKFPMLLKERNTRGDSIVHLAAQRGSVPMLERLVTLFPDFDHEDYAINNSGETPLHKAAQADRIKALEFLIKRAPQLISKKNKNGDTVLHVAARKGYIRSIQSLFERAPELFSGDLASNKLSATPLHDAAEGGNLSAVKFFMNNAPGLLEREYWQKDWDSPLSLAFAAGKSHVVAYLLGALSEELLRYTLEKLRESESSKELQQLIELEIQKKSSR